MPLEIILSILSGCFAIIVALISNKNKKLKEQNKILEVQHDKIETELNAITILFNHKFINILNESIEEIMAHTNTTRFVLLFAVNGKTDFNYVTACFERNKLPQLKGATKNYARLKIDQHYKKMLKRVEFVNKEIINTETLEPCLLKNIYESYNENVKNSVVYFLNRITLDESNDLLLYCSTATVDDKMFTPKELFLIDSNIAIIKEYSKHNLSISSEF